MDSLLLFVILFFVALLLVLFEWWSVFIGFAFCAVITYLIQQKNS
jgi:uncharacterized membrane protein